MNSTCRRGVALALVLMALASWVALADPSFSDQNTSAGNLNPTDDIMVMEVRVRGDTTYATTLTSVTVQNVGTATSSEIDRIRIEDGGAQLGQTTNLSGLNTGVTINLGGYNIAKGATHYIRVFVTVGGSVSGGETVELRLKFHYELQSTPKQSRTSAWISDRTAETIRDGGFDDVTSNEVATKYLNPLDTGIVQIAVFSDIDANGNDVNWVQTAPNTIIVEVENLGTATPNDVSQIHVTLRINGVDYETWDGDAWLDWNPASPMDLRFENFKDEATHANPLPDGIPDNGGVTATVEMRIENQNNVSDNRTIRTRTTLHVKEGLPANQVAYDHTATSGSTVTIRKQGFEEINEESGQVVSGTKATGETLIQTVKVIDDDSNGNKIRATQLEIQNLGSATGADLNSIEVKAGAVQLAFEDTPAILADFGAGIVLGLDNVAAALVEDDDELELKIYYELDRPVDGHTLQPQVRVRGREPDPPANPEYWSDSVVFPGVVTLYEAGLEIAENLTPPEGGTIYSGQRVEVQRIYGMDLDENTEDLTMHPFVIKNLGTAQENPDVVKIEITRSDTEDGPQVLMGEETDLAGFRTGGVRIDTFANNQILDKTNGSEVYLHIWVTLAEPETMVAGRTLQLETRILHTENLVSYDKTIVSNAWDLATNHRPEVDFTFEATEAQAEAETAAITPKADFKYTETIQFHGTATDEDDDEIVDWHWDFGDGNTSDEQNPTHQYPNGGTFDVTLTVTDERGVTGSVTKTIEVEGPPNEPPVIDELTADPTNPATGGDVVFAVTVTDPDQPQGTPFDYEWDFDDETTSTVAGPTHSFAEAGAYTVTVTVTDAQGASDTATIEISVGNEPPTLTGLTATPATKNTGDPVTFTAQGYDDPDDDPVEEYRWDFGDGTTDTTTGDNAHSTTHIYNAPGDYTVTVSAVDDRGGVSEAKTLVITVAGPARVVLYAFPNPASTTATVTYFLPNGATSPVLRIYSLTRELLLEQELGEGQTTFVWDLRSEDGQAQPNGLYLCIITATDGGGDTARSEVFRLLIAR